MTQPELGEVLSTHAQSSACLVSVITRHAEARTRLALAQTCKACYRGVLQTAEHATVTLLAYGGLSEVTWQRRLARAEQDLAVRGPQRSTKIVFRLPTPNPAALQSILSMPEAAGRAVRELEVRQRPSGASAYVGVHTAWLQALPAAFPHLHTLRISRLCGLPPPALLPHLKELHVQLCLPANSKGPGPHAACSAEQLCASIAPYIPQLAVLAASNEAGRLGLPWSHLFTTTVSTTLTHFRSDEQLTDELLGLLLKYAPALTHLRCQLDGENYSPQYAQATWGVKYIQSNTDASAWELLLALPQSRHGLQWLPDESGIVSLMVTAELEAKGLEGDLAQRFMQWQFAAPCAVSLTLPDEETGSELQTSIEAALRQLSCLPAGSEVCVLGTHNLDTLAASSAAIAATKSAMPHVTVWPVDMRGCDRVVGALCAPAYQGASVGLYDFKLSGAHAQAPWPWKRLWINTTITFTQLLRLPNPCQGEYEVIVDFIKCDISQLTSEMTAQLEQRLQHWTFTPKGKVYLILEPPPDLCPPEQHAVLRRSLQLLRQLRWRRQEQPHHMYVQLEGWALTPAVLAELAGLPSLPRPCDVNLSDCDWLPSSKWYEKVPSLLPACYSTLCVRDDKSSGKRAHKARHLIAICRGAKARGDDCEKLTLSVCYGPGSVGLKDTHRSRVEACVSEMGLGKCLADIDWFYDF